MNAQMPFRGRALLIEDTAIVALNAEDILRSMGFDPVDIATSVAEAIELARVHVYATAVIDLMVKDGSALPAATMLASRNVPLVFASGYSEVDLPDPLSRAPRVSKPYDDAMLHAALVEAHRQHAAGRR